jgi:hypothetical protein
MLNRGFTIQVHWKWWSLIAFISTGVLGCLLNPVAALTKYLRNQDTQNRFEPEKYCFYVPVSGVRTVSGQHQIAASIN